MGRPSKFKPEYVAQAAKLCALGATDREVSDFFGVEERTLNRWKLGYPDLCQALKLGKAEADDRVEKALYRRALGYSHEAVKIFNDANGTIAVPFVEHYPPDTTACIFWLKNRRKEEWRDRTVQEVSGIDGAPIRTESTLDMTNLTEDQLRVIASIRLNEG